MPSEKDGVLSDLNLDHFKCYKAQQAVPGSFERRIVTVTDQFRSRDVKVLSPTDLCNPVDKDGEGTLNERDHLTCYSVKNVSRLPGELRQVEAADQFGELSLKVLVGFGERLCVPSTKIDQDDDSDFED